MKVLVACEESQVVCKAFRARGHEAYSNDLQECSGGHPEWHLQMDAFQAIALKEWDLMTTCLWLRGLKPLVPTDITFKREPAVHNMWPGKDRDKLRAKTYPGIANAMASQWG